MATVIPAKRAREGSRHARKNRRVERAKQLIRNYGRGEWPPNQDASSCTLYLGEYRQLLQELNGGDMLNGRFGHGLRYDYTADNRGKDRKRRKQFVVRIPTAFHLFLPKTIEETIVQWIIAIREGRAQCGTGACPQNCVHNRTQEVAKYLMPYYNGAPIRISALAESDKKHPSLSYMLEDREIEDNGLDSDDSDSDDSDSNDLGNNNLDNNNLDGNNSDNNNPGSDDSGGGGLRFPGLVLEVGWSQTSFALRRKCEWYIRNSNGEVRTVIGIDLHDLYQCYPKSKTQPNGPGELADIQATNEDICKMAKAVKEKKATGKIFIWRAEIDSCTNRAKAVLRENSPHVFLDEDLKPVGEIAFLLCLEDFISVRVLKKIGATHNPQVAIGSKLLHACFKSAVVCQVREGRENEMKKNKEKSDGGGLTG
ncbi:hypothetical protein GQX73_g6008 [Xylaria multiplex]|uniref:Uncharacterized protein n=1 Tax=Xylaria multiplex TaxID=323545 RepID=A0A7C8MNR7_9PEZI|nr:hypothetical protein GQX73_g6008 [Xylaria multiplex]